MALTGGWARASAFLSELQRAQLRPTARLGDRVSLLRVSGLWGLVFLSTGLEGYSILLVGFWHLEFMVLELASAFVHEGGLNDE